MNIELDSQIGKIGCCGQAGKLEKIVVREWRETSVFKNQLHSKYDTSQQRCPQGSQEICSCLHVSKSVLSTNELLILCTGVGRTKYTPCECVCAAYVHKL